MSSRRDEDRKSRSRSEEKKTAATHKTPSIMVQLPCARGSSWSFGSKKAEKKMERKKSPASHTITMADFEKGEAPALIIPEDTGDLDGAVFDTATFERGPLTPLHATPKGADMPDKITKRSLVPEQTVGPAVPAPAPADDWRLQMRREMQEMMKESLRDMMAMMPKECNPAESRCSEGTGQAGAQVPQLGASSMATAPGTMTGECNPADSRYSLGTGQVEAQGPLAGVRNLVTAPETGPRIQDSLYDTQRSRGNKVTTLGTGLGRVQGPMARESVRFAVPSERAGLHGDQAPMFDNLVGSEGNVTSLGTGLLRAQGPLAGTSRGATLDFSNPPALRRRLTGREQAQAPLFRSSETEVQGEPMSFAAQVLSDLPEEEVWTNDGLEEATYFSPEEPEEEYNPFKGIQDLDGYSLVGLGSALPKVRPTITPSSRQLALWRQVRGGDVMDPHPRVDILDKIYSGDPAAKPFLDQEVPLEIPTSTKFQVTDLAMRKQQRDMGLVAHAITTGLEDLEGASAHLLSTVEEMTDGPVKDRLMQAHREVTQASTHPLGHALRLLGSKFNDLASKRKNLLSLTVQDKMLGQQIRSTPLGYDSLLATSLQPAVQASASRRQNELLMAALRNNTRPRSRYRSRSPVRRPVETQQYQQQRQGPPPFRRGSRGGRGSRGTRGARGTRGGRPSFSRRS